MHDSEYLKERHRVNESEYLKERRRLGDRRRFSYTAHAPERRSGLDRREMSNNKSKAKVA
jgi:transcription elongation GreA/GreB family factor